MQIDQDQNRRSYRFAWCGIACICVLGLLFAHCSTNSTGGDVNIDDTPPPRAIEDLRYTSMSPTSVTLEWTAPMPDEEYGFASEYDLRYTTYEPEPDDWDLATQVDGEPGVLPGGYTQTMIVPGLQSGSTYYFAIKSRGEGDNPNWSEVSNLLEVTLPVDFAVTFPDTSLERVIRNTLAKPTGEIMRSEMLTIIQIDAGNVRTVQDLTGLEHCQNLDILHLNFNEISDISVLAQLTGLHILGLYGNNVTDVTPLAGLTELEQLHLGENGLSDISPLAALTNLVVFRVHYNDISDISIVSGMTNLQWFDIASNDVTDLAPLVANTGIDTGDQLDVRMNPLSETARNVQIPALEARGVLVMQ